MSDFKGLAFELACKPDFGFATVKVPAGQMMKVEASAMATMTPNMKMKTKLKGGFGRFLTGESLFINEFTAEGGPGELGIAPAPAGDIEHLYLDNETVYLQNSAFVASSGDVAVESKWQGMMKGFFSGESLFLIKCSGLGDLFFNTYGGIMEVEVDGDYVVDTGHIVGFTSELDYHVSSVGGFKSLFFSGEGLVCRFTGHGKIWVQTRQVAPFVNWIYPYRPVKSKN